MDLKIYARTGTLSPFTTITITNDREGINLNDAGTEALEALINSLRSEPSAARLKPSQVIALYNTYATKHGWERVRVESIKLKQDLTRAFKELPDLAQWEMVLNGFAADSFFSGYASEYRPNIRTMLFKQRYMDFYNKALDQAEGPKKGTQEHAIDTLRQIMAGIA